MHTAINVIYAPKTLPEIPLGLLSGHPLENCFGALRRLLHDCNRFPDVLVGAAKNQIVEKVMEELAH
jgi:hypothetical protein